MSQNYYQQSDLRPATLTVGQLVERLRAFDPELPVIFQSPFYGAFGSHSCYSVDHASIIDLERREHHNPARWFIDEETGEEVHVEADTQVFNAWRGVVIS